MPKCSFIRFHLVMRHWLIISLEYRSLCSAQRDPWCPICENLWMKVKQIHESLLIDKIYSHLISIESFLIIADHLIIPIEMSWEPLLCSVVRLTVYRLFKAIVIKENIQMCDKNTIIIIFSRPNCWIKVELIVELCVLFWEPHLIKATFKAKITLKLAITAFHF